MRFAQYMLFYLSLAFLGCSKINGSINDIYQFSDTKDVRVRVNLSYSIDVQGGPEVAIGEQNFVLNAFLYQNGEKPIEIGYAGEEPLVDLPVILTGTVLSFDATMRIPAGAQAGPEGYALHFALKEAAQTGLQESSTVKNLDAMKGGIQPGADPSENPVSLSLATTLAYKIISDASVADGSISNVSAYEKLLTVVDEEIKKVGSTLDSSAKPSLATYASAILAGTKLAVMQSPTVQNSIVEILQTAAAASTGQASTTAVATSMSTVLKGFATDVKTALGSASANEIKIFKANTYDPATIPDPKTYVPTVFGGIKSIAFTDQDSTIAIGGTVLITPPTSEAGIDSYNVYFGGANLSDSRLSLITNILKTGSTLSYAIASGTLIATSVTNIWVYPVAAGKELDLPAETTLVNTIAPPGVPTSPGAVGGLASTVISWNPVASASAYTIYWSTTNSVTSSSQKITNATSPYTHNGLSAGTDYFYAISATKDGREGSLSNVVQARTSAALSFSGSLSLGKTQCSSQFNDIAVTDTGETYIAGTTNCDLPSDTALGFNVGFLAQFNSSGILVWTKTIYGSSVSGKSTAALAVSASRSGAIYVGGSTDGDINDHTSAPAGSSDIWYARYDKTGTIQWSKQMGSASATVELNSLASDDSGTLYAAGTTPSQLPSGPAKIGTKDGFLIKVNPTTGATTWLQTIGTTNGAMSDETEAAAVVVTRDGSQIYLMGSVNGDLTASGQDDDSIYLAKYSSSGTGPLWVRQTKDGNGPKRGLGSVALSPDESRVTFVGTTSIELIAGNNLTSSHLYKFTYDTAGNQTSFEQIASDRSTKVRDLSILADGSFIATGYTDSSLTGGSTIGSTDWFVVKFASNLTRSWLVERGMSGRTSQCMGSALDSAGNIITAGFSTGDLSAGSGAAPGGTAGYLLGFKPDGAPF